MRIALPVFFALAFYAVIFPHVLKSAATLANVATLIGQ